MPGIVIAAIQILERFYYLHRFVQMATDFYGSKPFRRTAAGKFFTLLSVMGIVPFFFYALQKYQGPAAALRRCLESARLRIGGRAVRRAWRRELLRLGTGELRLLGDLLASGEGPLAVYGHKMVRGKEVRLLPRSDPFSIERVRFLATEAAGDPAGKAGLAACITALMALRGKTAAN